MGLLTAICLSTFMLLLNMTIVVVALPDMAHSLDASLSDLQWVVDGYALALAALLLGAGVGADIVGRRRVHVAGVVVFAVASRAAAMFATTLPLLGSVYQGRERGAALGVWGAVSGAAAAALLGGVLTKGPGWRWIFFVNVPVSVVTVWLSLKVVPESRGTRGMRVDWAGMATFAVFAGGMTYAMVRAGEHGWTSTGTLTAFGLAAAALVAFVLVERKVAHPLLDLRLLSKPTFVGVLVGALAFDGVAFGVIAYESIWMQTLLGMDPVDGGLALLPLPAAAMVVAMTVGALSHRAAARWTMGAGLLLLAAGSFAQAFLDADSSWTSLVLGPVLVGVGTGLLSPTISGAALAAVPAERSGMAGGVVNTLRQLGYALMVAVYGTVLTSRMGDTLPHDAAHTLAGGGAAFLRHAFPEHVLRSAFASGLNSALVTAGSVGLVAGLVVLALVRGPRRAAGAGGDTAPAEQAPVTAH
ncbi:MFS transporter [Streptomyces sp. T028]|uniref:MFS transporter n=1 Tax=Streptomyces sp. T028 TaxID=3394379 RepID=UPI003A881C63